MAKVKTAQDRPAEPERGEVSITLEGEEMVLRPSHEAISAFERMTGKGLLILAREALNGSLSLGETAQVMCECIRAWGRHVDNKSAAGAGADRIAELVLESEGGFRAALATLAGVLSMAVTGGYTAQGEMKPTTTKTTAPVVG
jgi:hypothetical protein